MQGPYVRAPKAIFVQGTFADQFGEALYGRVQREGQKITDRWHDWIEREIFVPGAFGHFLGMDIVSTTIEPIIGKIFTSH